MTTFTQMRRGVAALRRNAFQKESNVPTNARLTTRFPVPYIADNPTLPDDKLRHGALANSIYNDHSQTIKCQVCSLIFEENDTVIFLIIDELRVEETWDLHIERDSRLLDREGLGLVHVYSNGGPVHLWCAHVSLMFCPAIRATNLDENEEVAWIGDGDPYDLMYNDDYVTSGNNNASIAARVPPESIITLAQLNDMLKTLKEENHDNHCPHA